jgi:hypothetical protein
MCLKGTLGPWPRPFSLLPGCIEVRDSFTIALIYYFVISTRANGQIPMTWNFQNRESKLAVPHILYWVFCHSCMTGQGREQSIDTGPVTWVKEHGQCRHGEHQQWRMSWSVKVLILVYYVPTTVPHWNHVHWISVFKEATVNITMT